jgi:hypothetical protein
VAFLRKSEWRHRTGGERDENEEFDGHRALDRRPRALAATAPSDELVRDESAPRRPLPAGPLILLALPPGGGAGDAKARRSYDLAAASATDLPPDPYGDTVRGGIARGLERVAAQRRILR